MNCKKCNHLQAEVNELWPYRKRAEKAEQERDEARRERDSWRAQVPLADWEKELVQHSEQSRPLTPDAITDEMVERGAVANWRGDVAHPDWTFEDISDEDRGWYRDNARAVLTAALTEPTRPEGAEKVEAVLHQYWSGDINGDDLADRIAEELNR